MYGKACTLTGCNELIPGGKAAEEILSLIAQLMYEVWQAAHRILLFKYNETVGYKEPRV